MEKALWSNDPVLIITGTTPVFFYIIMDAQTNLIILFGFIIVGFLVVDLGYLNRKSHKVEFKPALYQSLFWIAIALAFGFLISLYISKEMAAEFLSAYVTEKMLSVDNLFVMMLIFSYFKLEEKYHHRADRGPNDSS